MKMIFTRKHVTLTVAFFVLNKLLTYCGFVDQNWQYDIVRKHTLIDIFKY